MRRLSISLCLVSMMTMLLAAPVLAAPPANDTFAGRVAIGALPFNVTLDTTEATTDADDAEWNATCGAPATDASVWYSFTSASDELILVDTTGTDYTSGVAVVTGSPGTLETVACSPIAAAFLATAGVTYSIVAFDDQADGGGNGGTLNLTVDVAPPPPTVDVTVNPVGQFDSQTGTAIISGTVTCTGVADFTAIELELRQRAGRFFITGFGSTSFVCDGTTQEWAVEVIGQNGLFKGGRAASLTFAIACGPIECGADFEEATVHLRGGG